MVCNNVWYCSRTKWLNEKSINISLKIKEATLVCTLLWLHPLVWIRLYFDRWWNLPLDVKMSTHYKSVLYFKLVTNWFPATNALRWSFGYHQGWNNYFLLEAVLASIMGSKVFMISWRYSWYPTLKTFKVIARYNGTAPTRQITCHSEL